MRIDQLSGTGSLEQKRISNSSAPETRTDRTGTLSEIFNEDSSPTLDAIDISSRAEIIGQYIASAKEAPVIRQDRVEQAIQSLRDLGVNPRTGDIADALLAE